MAYVKDTSWARYKHIINKFINTDAGKQSFIWLKKLPHIAPYGEDRMPTYIPVIMEGLFQYNYIKTWPSNNQRNSITGEIDNSDTVLYISANLLSIGGYIDDLGYWDFNWAEDRFIINGKVYQPGGDTQVSQAKDVPLLFFVILQRISPEEQEKVLEAIMPHEVSVLKNESLTHIHNIPNNTTIKTFLTQSNYAG